MARRRRLDVTRGDPARPGFAEPDGAGDRPVPRAPIAQVTGESAAQAALDEVTRSLEAAREDGRLVLEIPLGEVDAGHLARDRVALAEDELAALVESIRLHGQRTPVEVTRLADGSGSGAASGGTGAGGAPWGLISGWRRLAALKRLHAETGEARFATIRGLIRRDAGAAAAYVAMVEENEVRVGLSYYERARIAALTAAQGLFRDERAAILSLFATASRAKRSKIASFLEIHRHLGDLLNFPAHIPERLGLRLSEALKTEHGPPMLRLALPLELRETPEQELAALARALDGGDGPSRSRDASGFSKDPSEVHVSRAKHPAPPGSASLEPASSGQAPPWPTPAEPARPSIREAGQDGFPGLTVDMQEGRGHLTVRISGPGLDANMRERIEAALWQALSGLD